MEEKISYLKKQDIVKNCLVELLNPGFFDTHSPEKLADIVAGWHHEEDDRTGKRKKIKTLPACAPPSTIKDVFFEFLNILYPVTHEFHGVYVQGSYATGDFVESSDLDLVYIVRNKVAKDPERLLKLRTHLIEVKDCLLKVDPYQHHGPYVLTPKIMQNYLESYLPLEVWKESAPIWGPRKLTFHVQDSGYHNKLWFENSVRYYGNDLKLDTEYDRKKFVCMANMIPAVLYPWKTGKYTTKPEAIKWMLTEYPKSYDWLRDLATRRDSNNYEDVEYLLKWTRNICNEIKKSSS